ncbi:GlsB/YeaQ/YmgE family stress response membrane protein [Allorhizocola rhizosphaerae]|uniref:GlsB/YeaQ/YmgE family stress response membrane protein n=1 Tax=Allorhizocola rhizosphaerae TaxID=1872709 RepID=UPI000E3DA657|nr:GlsB/YeaQ/YmgE family stress response membrane protein [Allorhizocola rhizosphaerae]
MTATGVISAILIGAIIGVLGRLVLPGRQSIPIWLTVVIGIAAALIGTFFARQLGLADTEGVDWTEILIQIVLAAAGVGVTAAIMSGRSSTRV